MSFDTNWDLDKYKEDHESDEHWQLRRAFMDKWKNVYPEERLVCLSMAFVNMEFMGCRYPTQLMHEVKKLSKEVAQSYRVEKKTKLQRTFVSASVAAEDRAKGVKREGGVVKDATASKFVKINFIPQGNTEEINISEPESSEENDEQQNNVAKVEKTPFEDCVAGLLRELQEIDCVDVKYFREDLFNTAYGRLVFMIRPWGNILWNINTSCQVCKVPFVTEYIDETYSICINGITVAEAEGPTKADARSKAEVLMWNRLREEMIILVVKEQWIAHGDSRISVSDVSGGKRVNAEFGTPIESSVATKMMKMMGWTGGGLGADSQGIAEPIRPNLQMVNRAGLGSTTQDIRHLRQAANQLMRRFIASDTIDVDLIFSSEFSKEERAQLHQCAQRMGLSSRSYGVQDRFLVVKKKLNPFALVRAVVEKGGSTPKYEENRFDIPKFYQLPTENYALYGDEGQPDYNREQVEAIYGNQLENLRR